MPDPHRTHHRKEIAGKEPKMKPKSKPRTTTIRCTQNSLKRIDHFRARMGYRTNAQAITALLDSHPGVLKK